MDLTVTEAAQALQVDAQAVRALLKRGDLPGRRVSGRWLIEPAALATVAPRARIRPLEGRQIEVMLAVLSGSGPRDPLPQPLTPSDRYRLRRRLDRLREAGDALALLHAWMANQPERVLHLVAPPAGVPDLADDPRVRASGASDPRSGMVGSAHTFYGWTAASDVAAVVGAHWLTPGPPGQVTLLASRDPLPAGPLPLGWVITDLARCSGPRERTSARGLLAEALTRLP